MKARRNSNQNINVQVAVDPEEVHVDETTGRRYSVNNTTGESAWLDEEDAGEASSANKPERKRQSFKKFEGDTGPYYQNIDTGDSVWKVPEGGEIVV